MWLRRVLQSRHLLTSKPQIKNQNHVMNNQSILISIQESVNLISDITPLQKEKATKICKNIFNQFIINRTNFWTYKQFAGNYFYSIIPSKRDYNLKHILVDNGILECDNSYRFKKGSNNGIAKGYRFGRKFFTEINISSTENTFTFSNSSNKSTISYYCPHAENEYFQGYYDNLLRRLEFDKNIDDLISDLSIVRPKDLIINENIKDEFVYITHDKIKYRYGRSKALDLAHETGNTLIKFKDKCYIDQPDYFTENKSRQLKITYCQSVFNIKNGLFYCNRNDTNTRLDYNLTGLKKELFSKLLFDGERLAELDIANAQFAIAAFINPAVDNHFVSHAQNGTLYKFVEEQLRLEGGDGKALMFRVAFDKVKSTSEFNIIRAIFPKYMSWVDQYKKKQGYKLFSNLLQRTEAEIMIDGLLTHLIKKGYEVFTIHDALRVKQSQADEIKSIIENYFNDLGFMCYVRRKD